MNILEYLKKQKSYEKKETTFNVFFWKTIDRSRS
jgi:hypothetical protein